MSWMKRPQGGAAQPPGPERQPFTAPQAQPFGNQQNMYPNYQGGTTGNIQPQQFWQMPPQQQPHYNQQYGQVYQQQDYPANANQFYQQPNPNQFNQNYTSQGFNSGQPQSYQQNYCQNQAAQQQNFPQNKPNADSWEDNWDWGWEESAKQAQKASQNAVQQPAPIQQQVFNNANVIEESFASTDSWNWAMDGNKETKEPATVPQNNENKVPDVLPVSNPVVENNIVPEPSAPVSASNTSAQNAEEVRTLNDREVVKERLPNLALGKRFHLENLTPQWSIESQMSQESSDGPHTQSEGTYRSENQSRNSSKSSPGLNTDNSNFNYSQAGLDEGYPQNSEWSRPIDEPALTDTIQSNSRRESHDELSSSMQEMNLSNHKNPSTETLQLGPKVETRSFQDHISAIQPSPAVSPANFPAPAPSNHPPPSMSSVMPPPPPVSSVSLAYPPSSSSAALSAPSSTSSILPPNFPPPTSNQNLFKMNAGPFSHKTIAKASTSATTVQAFPLPPMSGTNLTSPAVVSKASQHNRLPVGFEANLETTPDNSERPDQPQVSAFRPMPISQQMPENMEVAPRNDRNEYLQTAHLSSGDYGENTDFSRGAPPPGLRRMVVGQQESEYNQNLNISGDEPPPGLARMVPGQQTEAENAYHQPGDNYLDRHIDGQTTDSDARPYQQADGQQTPDNYTQPAPSRVIERRPIGLDRMVPGEPSNNEYSQYQGSNYTSANEPRVVTGLDHDFSVPTDTGPPDIREQNVDGSDYTEQSSRNPPRNIIGARESSNNVSPEFSAPPDEQQREITMEGENLQDLSVISSTELTFSRELVLEGADVTLTDMGTDRKTDLSDSVDHPVTSSRRQSLNRVNTSEEDSERDRAFKSSARKDKHKSTRDRDQNRDRDRDRERDKDGRYSRGDRKYDPDRRSVREERRTEKERRERDDYTRERRDREASPDARRHRRSTRSHRYETEDTDYYSDRERDRRRHREGSYSSSKPPRPEDKERRYGDERDRSKRYHTIERDRRFEDDRERRERRRGERYRDRYERAYRDIDPSRKYGNLRKQRDKDDPRRGEFSSPSRPDSREATVTDEEPGEPGQPGAPGQPRRRADTHRRTRRTAEPFYDEYGGGSYTDPYLAARQQYQYYEQLRLTDPAAYMLLYKQLMAGRAPPAAAAAPPYIDFGSLPYDGRREERGSVHSGRSSTTGLKGNDTYYGYRHDAASLRDAPSLRTDLSDRDLTTDMSLNLHLEESTVRSERMTPFRYSTAHIKGSIGSRDVVVVRPMYPVDGAPATVQLLSLASALAAHPHTAELAAFPGPLVKGVTHKKSVIEYCGVRVRSAASEGARDVTGYVLMWELLALMLRQNGVVVGSDIAELLMKNTREYEYKIPSTKTHNESRRGSSLCGSSRDGEGRTSELGQPRSSELCQPRSSELGQPRSSELGQPRSSELDQPQSSELDQPELSMSENLNQESLSSPGPSVLDERAALDRLRELLIYGNRPEALEWAMRNRLWGHALQLAAHGDRRTRAAVAARFVTSLPRADPLHTLYAALAATPPPAATCVSDERWGDWRPHVAMLLANPSARADHDRRTLTQLGDSLSSRGLLYSAQFCYVSAGVQLARHPLAPLQRAAAPGAAPPRLALLLADPRARRLAHFAHNRALFATEVYEYALSLNRDDFAIAELQPYKLLVACRLLDCGLYERALGYTEAAARAVTRAPRDYPPALVAHLATLADRLKYHDPSLQEDPPLVEEADSAEPSPRHHQQWLDDVKQVADMLSAENTSQQTTPQHNSYGQLQEQQQQQQQQYGWGEQPAQQYQQPVPTYPEPPLEETPDYSQQYYSQPPPQQQPQQQQQQQLQLQQQQPAEEPQPQQQQGGYEDWSRGEEPQQSYEPYWQGDTYGYGEGGAAPTISMPGASKPRAHYYADTDDTPQAQEQQNERDTDTPKSAVNQKQESKSKEDGSKENKGKGGGWLGGILTKLSLRPPNQMILPDDKNPTIVWDAETKRWRNLDGDEDEREPPPPPPRAAHLPRPAHPPPPAHLPAPARSSSPSLAAPPQAPVSNIFKMQKGRHIKKSYVDVLNPRGAAPAGAAPPAPAPAPAPAPPPPPPAAPPQYFVPAPLHTEPDIERPEAVAVMMPPSPSPSPSNSASPPPSPVSDVSGVYEPSLVEPEPDPYQRTGI